MDFLLFPPVQNANERGGKKFPFQLLAQHFNQGNRSPSIRLPSEVREIAKKKKQSLHLRGKATIKYIMGPSNHTSFALSTRISCLLSCTNDPTVLTRMSIKLLSAWSIHDIPLAKIFLAIVDICGVTKLVNLSPVCHSECRPATATAAKWEARNWCSTVSEPRKA